MHGIFWELCNFKLHCCRDSNRGGCIQSCRFSYSIIPDRSEKENYIEKKLPKSILSSKDLRGIQLLPDFIKAGVDSIKIEGRMKSSLYVATTSSLYSRAIKFCKGSSTKKKYDQLKIMSLMEASIEFPDEINDGSFINYTDKIKDIIIKIKDL